MLDQDSVTDALKGVGPVFHLAAMADVNDIVADPAESVALNTLGVARVLEAARRADAGRVIVSSTVWVYAATHGDEVDETTLFDLDTDRHLYVSEKIAAEMFCRDYATLSAVRTPCLRYGIPFGPRMRSDLVVAAFLLRAMRGEPLRIDGDGSQERRFVYVEDLAAAHVLALEAGREEPHVQPRVRRGDLDPAARRDGARPRRRCRSDVRAVAGPATTAPASCSSDRARDELGWVPQHTFAEGLRKTLAWYREQQDAGIVATAWRATPRRIAVVPAYNEEPMVAAVLDELYPLVDELVVVDDGSTDSTRAEIEQWMARGRPELPAARPRASTRGCRRRTTPRSTELRDRLARGELDADDLVFTVDADGQHDLHVLDELVEMTHRRGPRREPRPPRPLVPRPVQADRQLGALEMGERSGPARRCTTSSRAIASSASARWRTRSTTTRATSTARRSKSRSCCASSATRCATTTSCRCRSRGHAPALRDAVDRPRGDPGCRGTRVAPRPRSARRSRTDAVAHLAIAAVLGVLFALTYAARDRHAAHARARRDRRVRARRAHPPVRARARRSRCSGRSLALVAAWLVPQRPDIGERDRPRGVVRRRRRARRARRSGGPARLVLAGAFAVLVVVRLGGTRATSCSGSPCSASAAAARGARFGRVGMPQHAPRCALSRIGTHARDRRRRGLTGYFGASTVGATWFGGGVMHGPRDVRRGRDHVRRRPELERDAGDHEDPRRRAT